MRKSWAGTPYEVPAKRLAAVIVATAAATVVATAAAVIVAVDTAVVAAATEQDEQNDDPAHIATAETVIKHKNTSRNFIGG